MSQRKTLSKVPLTPQFTTIGLSYADVVKCDMSNHVHVSDHSYSTSIQSVEENCTRDHSYLKNTSVTKIPVIDHSKVKGDHGYADEVKVGDKHQYKHVLEPFLCMQCGGKWCSS